jgi:hypothetical protein
VLGLVAVRARRAPCAAPCAAAEFAAPVSARLNSDTACGGPRGSGPEWIQRRQRSQLGIADSESLTRRPAEALRIAALAPDLGFKSDSEPG